MLGLLKIDTMKRLRILTLISCSLAGVIFYFKKKETFAPDKGLLIPKEWTAKNEHPITPSKYRRRADQGFLSYPEWYLVFSPKEQASYFKHHTASRFPYMKHTGQIWDSYKIIKAQTDSSTTFYKPNEEYHLMINVINSSATIEYTTRAWYERVVGRLTDTRIVETDEDRFAAVYMDDYVSFINDNFWYEFDFKDRLGKLWTTTSFYDDHFLRKLERKYCLSTELMVKWGYGKVIKYGAESMHGPDETITAVLVNNLPKKIEKKVEILQEFEDKSVLISLPRYKRFNPAISELAYEGLSFKEIAGNNSAILVSVIVPKKKYISLNYSETILIQPITSNRKMKRILVAVKVENLHKLILKMKEEDYPIEHIFDY